MNNDTRWPFRIVHFSDWHGRWQELPPADLYVCTGDMYPNSRACMWADKDPETRMQIEVAKRMPLRVPNGTPTLLVRGNHDYANLIDLFGHGDEFRDPTSLMIGGLRFGGFRGVPPICGEWADEMGEAEIEHRCNQLGPVDVFVTHAPPAGRLDNGYGSKALRDYVDRVKPRAHLFGHIHEAAGVTRVGGTTFSNAAMTINELRGPTDAV